MKLRMLSCFLVYVYFLLSCSAVPRAKDYQKISGRAGSVPLSSSIKPWDNGLGREPSCEELRAMWRFSKRQSRATEITNEISNYRDPFAYNVWEPHARSRSVGGGVLKGGGGRGSGRHIYGRVVHAVPRSRLRENLPERNRAFEEVARHLVTYPDGTVVVPRRKITAFRFSGNGAPIDQMVVTPQAGSFQQLKNIIRAERARELQEQRMAEEAAARAAALREAGIGPYTGRMIPQESVNYDSTRYGRRSISEKRESDTESKASDTFRAFPELITPGVDDDFISFSALAG